VLVDVDLAKDLIYRVLVERKGFAFFVDVEYENLPPFCDHCNIIGHKFENCKIRKDAPKKVISEHAKHNVSVQPKDKVDEIIDIEGSTSKQYTQVNHAQERLDADKVLEEEINKETVDVTSTPEDLPSADIVVHDNPAENIVETLQNSISSEQSEFVDNTQVTQDGNVKSQDHVDSVHIPLLVHNDIQFLKESWANLAELEEQNALPSSVPLPNQDKPPDIPVQPLDVNKIADTESPSSTDNDGFKLVTSRSARKISTKTPSHKNSYITRSKVGSPKHFK
jgi:hypothetical protein